MGRQGDTVTKGLPRSMRRPPNPAPFRPREKRPRKGKWGSGARGVGTERGRRSRAGSTLTAIAPRWGPGVGKNQGWSGSRPAPPSRGGRGWCVTYTRRLPSTQDFRLELSLHPNRLTSAVRISRQRRRVRPTGSARNTAACDLQLNASHFGTRTQSPVPDHPRRPPSQARNHGPVCHTSCDREGDASGGSRETGEASDFQWLCRKLFCLLKQTIVC